MKVEVGCGKKQREGYICCDIRSLKGVDHICSADKLPFESGTVDEVYSRHTLEHFSLKEAIIVLKEWNRVLKPEGVLYVIVPNLLFHAQQLVSGTHESIYEKESGKNARYWAMGSLFGWQQDKHDIHKFGYYYELLRDLLVEMGFGDIENLTEQPYSLEKAPWHLEVKAQKKFKPKNDKENIFMSLLDVTH